MHSIKKIEMNTNPNILVFNGGVLDLATSEFRPSHPTEYISDEQIMGVQYEPPDIEKMQWTYKFQLSRLIVNEDERESWLSHCSTFLHGVPLKGIPFQFGPSSYVCF